MFDLSLSEILLVLLAIIILCKPEDLPEIMKTLGKFYGKIKVYTNEILDAFNEPKIKQIKGDDGKFYEAYDIKKDLDE